MRITPYTLDITTTGGPSTLTVWPLETDGVNGNVVARDINRAFRYNFASFTAAPDIFVVDPVYENVSSQFLVGTYFYVTGSTSGFLDGLYVVQPPGPSYVFGIGTSVPVTPVGHVIGPGPYTNAGTTSWITIAGDIRYRLTSGFNFTITRSAGAESGYQDLLAAAPITNPATTSTGLVPTTVYTLIVTVDGGGAQTLNITGSTAQTYNGLLTQIAAGIDDATVIFTPAIPPYSGIRIVSESVGISSTVVINPVSTLIAGLSGSLGVSTPGVSGINDGPHTVPVGAFSFLNIAESNAQKIVTQIPLNTPLATSGFAPFDVPPPYGFVTYTAPISTSLQLPGRGAVNWAFSYDQDLLELLQSNAGTRYPTPALLGQLSYRSDLGTLWICTDETLPTWTEIAYASGQFLRSPGDSLLAQTNPAGNKRTPLNTGRLYYTTPLGNVNPADLDPDVLVTRRWVLSVAGTGVVAGEGLRFDTPGGPTQLNVNVDTVTNTTFINGSNEVAVDLTTLSTIYWRLDGTNWPTANMPVNPNGGPYTNRLINVGDPVNPQDAVTLNYLNNNLSIPYDLLFTMVGVINVGTNTNVGQVLVPRTVFIESTTIPTLTRARCVTAPATYNQTFIIKKYDTAFVSTDVIQVQFTVGSTTGVVTALAGDITLNAGDMLQIFTDATNMDTTMADTSIVVVGCAVAQACSMV